MHINHYEVLALPCSPGVRQYISQQDIKLAYRRALLQHHPDKSANHQTPVQGTPLYTVDEITKAYKTLSTPSARSEFDRQLQVQSPHRQEAARQPLSGLETFDLDDIKYDSKQGVWYRSCRCGNERGYLISENDLEREAEHGELVTGCGGCSLWVRIVFQLVEEA